jgi:hypothetical protein
VELPESSGGRIRSFPLLISFHHVSLCSCVPSGGVEQWACWWPQFRDVVDPTDMISQRNTFLLVPDLHSNDSCYKRMLFVNMCATAMDLFSRRYFKDHFFMPLIDLSGRSVCEREGKICDYTVSTLCLIQESCMLHNCSDSLLLEMLVVF